MSAHQPNQADVVLVREKITTPAPECYAMVRYYRHGEDNFRVTVLREVSPDASCAVAQVLTTEQEWQTVVRAAPSKWHRLTFQWLLHTLPSKEREDVLGILRTIADELASDAAAIVPA